jgi:hypothetical protein
VCLHPLDTCAVQILEVSPDQNGSGGFRVHGSMRVVDQESGQDLDPTGQMAAARGPGKGSAGRAPSVSTQGIPAQF